MITIPTKRGITSCRSGGTMPTDLKPTTQQQERAKYADPLWELHNSINRLVAACAYEIIGGADPKARKRELAEAIADVSAKYLGGEE